MNTAITEAEFAGWLEDLCGVYKWAYYHTWRSDHSVGGWPDYCLCKPPRILFVEVKSEKGKITSAQQAWITMLQECGLEVYVWRPSQRNDIEEILK